MPGSDLPLLWRAEHVPRHGVPRSSNTSQTCRCRRFHEPNPRCERPDGGFAWSTPLPKMLCLGDSIGHPSCAAAAPALAASVEVATFRVRGKLLNTMSSKRLLRCVGSYLGSDVRWRVVAFNAGAWDLSTGRGACCETGARLEAAVLNLRRVLLAILQRADLALWVTTTPVPEIASCCRRLYGQPSSLPDAQLTVGYCNGEAAMQNTRVAAVIGALPARLSSRVGTADTWTAVNTRCGGGHYTDCPIQPQARGCNCHFEKPSYPLVHGPVIAAAALRLLARAEEDRHTSPRSTYTYTVGYKGPGTR